MAQSSFHSFKNYVRGQRMQMNEQAFNMGMQFHDNALDAGASRLLVNLSMADQGRRLRPRGGKKKIADVLIGAASSELYQHHTGASFVKFVNDAVYRRYALLGCKNGDNTGMPYNTLVLLVERVDGTLVKATLDPSYIGTHHVRYRNNAAWTDMHGVPLTTPQLDGINASIDGNTYLLTPTGLVRLEISTSNDIDYMFKLVDITYQDIGPIQAVNYGYNMLDPQPYNFPNVQGATLRLEGILPYDPVNNVLKLNAKVGESIRFSLNYMYPAGADTYKVQWEIQDITTSGAPTVIQAVANSPTYSGGNDIYLDAVPPFKQFSMVAKIYKTTDLTNPVKAIQLASYYMSADGNDKNRNLTPQTYNLLTAKGMCQWNNQLVLWGVSGANMSIFISDTNNPAYFPFPQNSHPFNEEVLRVVPFMDFLLVFTETKIHAFAYQAGVGFVTRLVQDNLKISAHDANTIVVIKNMAFFKSDNYYYMVVPSIKKDNSTELQLAPISKPITQLLDNFAQEMRASIDDVYTLEYLFNVPNTDITMDLQYFYNYLDNSAVHNVYKYKLTGGGKTIWVDLHLMYDTLLRAWTIEVFETNGKLVIPYRRVATDNAKYINLYKDVSNNWHLQTIRADTNDPVDDISLDGTTTKTIKNYQVIDTGKRDMMGTLKKRFRHIVLEINNLSKQDLEFNDVFLVDDDVRKELFHYTIEQITDTQAPNYGTIYVTRSYVEPTVLTGTTMLGQWKLGMSAFPEQTLVKVWLQDINGKGYYPRLRLISRNEIMYELNGISWVMRMMNAR